MSSSTAVTAPLSIRAAIAILGSMLLLIAALTVVLIQTTRTAVSLDTPPTEFADPRDFARR